MSVRKRPFTLFYGESTRVTVNVSNYHMRSRAVSLISAIRASITRFHNQADAVRVDIYDIDDWHVATVVARGNGFEVKLTPWAVKQHFAEMRHMPTGSYGIY